MGRKLWVLLAAALSCAQAASTGKGAEGDCSKGDLRNLHHYYEELACKPLVKAGESCASSYDCSHLETRDKSKCYFKGQTLDTRPDVKALEPSACQAACLCRQTKEAGAVAMLNCANIECPTLFNPSLIPKDCVATYSAEMCCSDGVLCPQNVTTETAKCEWGGKTYLEGQKFYPDEEPCSTCTCQKGFDGTLAGPWCKKLTCGLELHSTRDLAKGCAPVFYKDRCCPIEWRCPADDDVVVAAAISKNPAAAVAEAGTCRWGALMLKQGESLNAPRSGRGPCQRCRCDLPPHVLCVTDGQPCDATPAVAAPEPLPEAAVDAAKARLAHS